MIKKTPFLSYFLPLFLGFFIFSGILFYVFYLQVQKIEHLVDDINSQIEFSSQEKLNGYDTKEFSLEWLSQEEITKVESVIRENDWDTLSLKEIDDKLEKNWLSPIGNKYDAWYEISPTEVYKVVSEEEWDTLSFADIDAKLKKAGFPEAGDPLSPLYTLTPEEVKTKYGETGVITYIWEKQLTTLKEVTHFYDSYITLVGIVACLVFGLLGAYFFLLKAQKPLREALEKQKQFVSDVSHEIRTPLALMRSETEVLQKNKDISKDTLKEFTSNVLSDIDTLSGLTSRLLSLTKLEWVVEIKKEKISLKNLLETASETFTKELKKKNITLKNTVAGDVVIYSDIWFLTQLVSLFLENAIKYTDKSPANITFTVQQKKWTISLYIIDEGVGIDIKDIPHIFDRFYRASKDRHTPWFGIGLSIAQKIADVLWIHIKVLSKKWAGTTIHLIIKNEK